MFMKHERTISKRTYLQWIKRLREIDPLFSYDTFAAIAQPDFRQNERELLDLDRLSVISDWFHFAILSLTECDDFKGEVSEFSRRLGIPQKVAFEAVQRLVRLGMLKLGPDGLIKPTYKGFATPTEIPHEAIRKSHFQSLDLARLSLERDRVDERSFTGLCMAIDPSRLPEVKRRIEKFSDQIASFLEGGKRNEVYWFSFQLFPIRSRGSERTAS